MNYTRATITYKAFLWLRQPTYRQPYDAHFDVISTVYFTNVNDLSFDVLTQKSLNCVLKILTCILLDGKMQIYVLSTLFIYA